MAPYLLCTILLLIGIYGIIAKKNLVKIIIGIIEGSMGTLPVPSRGDV